jgi:hypothetical protein
MTYTVFFNPTNADYKALQKQGFAPPERSEYPVVSKSGFRTYDEAQEYIDSQCYPGIKSHESYFIRPGSYPDPDLTWG